MTELPTIAELTAGPRFLERTREKSTTLLMLKTFT